MIAKAQPISVTDLDALATLANTKLSPSTPYQFPAFAGKDKIGLPSDIDIAPTYGSGFFTAGSKVTLNLFAYKTIAGRKTYTWIPLSKAFYSNTASGLFSLTWNWTSIVGDTAPDGYIVTIPRAAAPIGWTYYWKDIGAVQTLTEDGTFAGWQSDDSLAWNGVDNVPCGHGIWLKTLNLIRRDLCLATDIECLNSGDVTGLENIGGTGEVGNGTVAPLGAAGLASGPWCVGVGSQLSAWIGKVSMYVQAATTGFTLGYTQCYRQVKFYFRAADGPTVNITAQNKLTSYRIGSDIPVGTSAHYHLKIVSCSTGHIKVQDSGGGTVRSDIDVVAGMVYDLSYDVSGTTPTALSLPRDIDITFTTAAASGLGVADLGIEISNDVRSIDVPDSYCELEFNNPVKNSGGGYDTIQLCTTCTQLVLTENNGVTGIWVALTLPTMGVMSYLDQDLPQYSPDEDAALASSRRVAISDSLPYVPSVNNRGALYPVFRDTDFVPDSVVGSPYTGSRAWQDIVFTKQVLAFSTNDEIPAGGVDNDLFIVDSVFLPIGTPDARFLTSAAGATLYVKAGDFPTFSDFDASVPAGAWLSLASLIPGFATGTVWYVGILNPGSDSITSLTRYVVIENGTPPNGTFFPTITDDDGNQAPKKEGYSFHFSNPASIEKLPIPLLGYCVSSITARRQPTDNGSGILIAPAVGTSDLAVEIGIMVGFGYSSAGAFTLLQTITIPAGQASATLSVFLPVLSGTPLVYRSASVAVVRASVNFQPQMHSQFSPATVKSQGADYVIGYYGGTAWFDYQKALLTFDRGFTPAGITLPLTVEIYNDLETLLNLL